MPTEAELIRDLRILYGISPPDEARYTDYLDRSGKPTPGSQERARAEFPAQKSKFAIEAERNQKRLSELFDGIRRSTLDEGTRDLNTRFVDTLRRDTSSLAARGLSGGSAARSTQSRTLTDLLLGRQRLAGATDSADQNARQSLDEQRQATERQIKLGTQPDVTQINALREASSGMNQAYRGLTEQALGGLFTRAGDTYRDTTQAEAYGRRGWGTLSPSQTSTGSAGGRIYQ